MSREVPGWGSLAKAQSRSPHHVWVAEEGLHPLVFSVGYIYTQQPQRSLFSWFSVLMLLPFLPSWSCRPGTSQTSQQELTAPLKTSPSQRAALRMERSTAALPLPRTSSPSPGAAVSLCPRVGKKPETNIVPCVTPQTGVEEDRPPMTAIPVSGSRPHLGSWGIGGEGTAAHGRLVL